MDEQGSLEEQADRIGAVIAWLVAALCCEVAGRGGDLDLGAGEEVVRGWISGLEPGARAHFLALALSDCCYAEGPPIVRAIGEGLAWPGVDARSRAALDPAPGPCEPVPHAAGHSVRRVPGAGRVQPCAGRGDAVRDG